MVSQPMNSPAAPAAQPVDAAGIVAALTSLDTHG
jgi:hypothetical protein